GTGKFHPTAVKQLLETGDWLRINGEGIYGSRPRQDWQEGDFIRYTTTKDGKLVYAYVTQWPGKKLTLQTVRPKAGSPLFMLGYNQPLAWKYRSGKLTISLPAQMQDPANRPCQTAWAFKIEQ
ncbi:MAG TPA: alpha-L-fucosidase C-terminal domain-containing protein, partial [Flavihumibacter sp.]|nr:alpha-L-fucosidase C-terminal domain-containing protein [Flavihumibacter sp.]